MRNLTCRVLLVLAFVVAAISMTAAKADAASFRYSRGWTVQGGWLCYGFSNGVWHCTQHWYRDRASGLLVSTNPSWVPSQATVATTPPAPPAPPTPPAPSGNPSGGGCANGGNWLPGGVPGDSCNALDAPPYSGSFGLWTTPPGAYSKVYWINPALYPARGGWPTCSWWAKATDTNFAFGGGSWHSQPRVGATIRYAPGVFGASSEGHYGHVVAVYSNGWILSSEMNFWWRGGGSGRVIFRFVPIAGGETFLY